MKKENSKKKAAAKGRSTGKLNQDQMRNLGILVVLPIIVIATWSMVGTKATEFANNMAVVQAVNSSNQKIDQNRDVFDMLNSAKIDYIPRDIFAGLSANSMKNIFIPAPKEKVEVAARVQAPAAVAPTSVAPSTPVVVYHPDKVTFIFSGQERSYVIIDGKFLRQGDVTLSGYNVSKIENNRVLLTGKRGSKWVTVKF